jgi:hypothetical protein
VLGERLVVCFKKFEWFWYASHGCCGASDDISEFSKGFEVAVLDEPFAMTIYFFLKFSILETLHELSVTKSYYLLASFFLSFLFSLPSFLAIESDIFKKYLN